METAERVFSRGWSKMKLYFMIGLPTERDDDIEAIADLALRTVEVGRGYNRKAKVHTGVSTFVPKPFTPFQWARQIDLDETNRRQEILHSRFRNRREVKFGRHHADETFIEGLIGRGDRRVGDLIEAAWRRGARFDAWDEHRDLRIWLAALEDTGLTAEELLRERDLDERLPWDHLDILMEKRWFAEDWQRAMVLQHAPDCRHSKCHRCGVIDHERALCASMLRNSIDGRKAEKGWSVEHPATAAATPGAPPPRLQSEGPVVQRLVFRIGVRGEARFLSHLEYMNAWLRSLRRIRLPLAYSEGFHPHPRMAFAAAHPVGEESWADYLDVLLNRRERPEDLAAKLAATVPEGFEVMGAWEVPVHGTSLMALVRGAEYSMLAPESQVDALALAERVQGLLDAGALPVQRRGKDGAPRTVDLRPRIDDLAVAGSRPGWTELRVRLVGEEGPSARPSEILGALGLDAAACRVIRRETLFRGGLFGQLHAVEAAEGAAL